MVRAGQIMARLDDREFRLADRTAAAAVSELEVRLAQARRDRTRVAGLVAAKAATTEELEQVGAASDALEAAHEAAVARRDESRRLLTEAVLTAPFDGTVTAVHREPGEQVTVDLDDATARRLGLTADAVAAQLAGRTRILPGGSLARGDRTVRLRPFAEMESVAEIAASPLALAGGGAVPVGEVASVRIGPREPAGERMRLDGELAVGLGVVAEEHAHAIRFGDRVRERIAAIAPTLAPLEVRTLAFQPARVGARLSQLNRSLLMGILIVAGVVVLAMGLRLGLVMASVVSLVTFAALALFAIGGGMLHQISIAALVLALGMLVNNAIVLLEVVEQQRRAGSTVHDALAAAIDQRIRPILLTTATTVCGLLPLAFSSSTLWPPLAWAMISGLIASTLLTLVVVPALYRTMFSGSERRRPAAVVPAAAAAMLAIMLATVGVTAEPLRPTLAESIARAQTRAAAVAADSHAAGRATTNDLLVAQAQLRDKRTQRDVAALRVVRAWVELWLATAAPELGATGSQYSDLPVR